MDMLEDYLRAVSRLLPRLKRDDIIAELRDEILTRIEARETELNRPLTEAETEQLLRDFGHPIVVAARYRDGPQYIVGPALYPYWIFAVRFAVILEICVSALVFFGRAIGGANVGQAFGQAIGSGISGAMTLIGFATLAAWLIERKTIKIDYFTNWRVRDLRFLDFAFTDWTDFSEWMAKMNTSNTWDGNTPQRDYGREYNGWHLKHASAGRGVAAIAIGTVFILWWVGLVSFGLRPAPMDYQALHIDPGALANIDLAAIKAALFVPVLAYFAALIGFGCVVLAFPRSVRLRGVIDMALGLSAMALAGWVWTASPVSEAIRVHGIDAFVDRVEAFFANPMPIPLVTFAMVIVAMTFIGGLFRALGGLWEVITGAPRYTGDC